MKMLLITVTLILGFSHSESVEPQGYSAFSNYVLSYFNATIDHYAPNSAKFPLKYYIRSDYFNQSHSGPIFFYCGGETAIESFLNNTGFIDTLAGQMDALVVYAEHRYFGSSLPFGASSFNSTNALKYLSPHQALADYAELISHLRRSYFVGEVITWGGGYGGTLAAWFRMKYPHLTYGSIASSAPLLAFNGSNPYAEAYLTTKHFSIVGGPECPAVIRTAYDYLDYVQYHSQYYFDLQRVFDTCQDIVTPADVVQVMNWLYQAFTALASFDYPTASNYVEPLPANPVSAACAIITAVNNISDYEEVLLAVAAGANVFYNTSGTNTCNDLSLAAIESSANEIAGDFLRCTTMNRPLATSGQSDMFWKNTWNQAQVDSQCLQTWGEATQVGYAALWYGTSSNYTHLLRHASNIVFSGGSLDPMLYAGINGNSNPNIIAFIINGGMHHSELRAISSSDPSEVAQARSIISLAIKYWVNGTIS